MKRLFIYSLLLFGVILLVSCANDGSELVQTRDLSTITDNNPSEDNGYPAKETTNTEGYPGPVNVNNTPDLIMEMVTPSLPKEGFSTLTGVLMLDIDGDSKPIGGIILYLGEILTFSNGLPGVAAVDKQTAPSAMSSGVGQFVFENVEPGEYVLIIDKITQMFVLNNPGGGNMIIDVRPNKITDVGELHYNEFPIDVRELP